MLKEFQDFINRGNVIDLAVAVVIGAAFGLITKSLVDHIIMPPIGLLLGGVDFSNLGVILRDADQYATVADAVAAGAPVIQYGAFIQTIINFIIIAFAIFIVVKLYNNMRDRMKKKEGVPDAPDAPSRDQILLTEIRDLLAQQNKPSV